ncbi:MAG: hypothetical protein JO326_14055 [Acetobacteraceae bacterium]|nr:hypothetical protein [Acetobacteraceae bacterium]
MLPIDYAAHARDLLAELTRVQEAAGDRFDLSPALRRVRALAEAVAKLRAPSDATLMALARALVPMEYTTGDRFDHDRALGQAPCPPLDPVRRLANAAPDSDEARFLTVAATRGRNRLCHALDCALEVAGRG